MTTPKTTPSVSTGNKPTDEADNQFGWLGANFQRTYLLNGGSEARRDAASYYKESYGMRWELEITSFSVTLVRSKNGTHRKRKARID